jgi:hypothetical protein
MFSKSIYKKVFYQTIDFNNQPDLIVFGIDFFTIKEEFINKNYNFIEGFYFDYPENEDCSRIQIDEFRIDDLEILPKFFPIDVLKSGKSVPFQEKFIPLNIPVRSGAIRITLNQLFPVAHNPKINLVFKLSNTTDQSLFYKDYFKYQILNFNTGIAPDYINRFEFRPNTDVKKFRGVMCRSVLTGASLANVNTSNPLKNYQLGSLKISINSKKTTPINIPIYDQFTPYIKFQQEFIELNEQYEHSSNINVVFEEHDGSSIPTLVAFPSITQLIFKYEI